MPGIERLCEPTITPEEIIGISVATVSDVAESLKQSGVPYRDHQGKRRFDVRLPGALDPLEGPLPVGTVNAEDRTINDLKVNVGYHDGNPVKVVMSGLLRVKPLDLPGCSQTGLTADQWHMRMVLPFSNRKFTQSGIKLETWTVPTSEYTALRTLADETGHPDLIARKLRWEENNNRVRRDGVPCTAVDVGLYTFNAIEMPNPISSRPLAHYLRLIVDARDKIIQSRSTI